MIPYTGRLQETPLTCAERMTFLHSPFRAMVLGLLISRKKRAKEGEEQMVVTDSCCHWISREAQSRLRCENRQMHLHYVGKGVGKPLKENAKASGRLTHKHLKTEARFSALLKHGVAFRPAHSWASSPVAKEKIQRKVDLAGRSLT